MAQVHVLVAGHRFKKLNQPITWWIDLRIALWCCWGRRDRLLNVPRRTAREACWWTGGPLIVGVGAILIVFLPGHAFICSPTLRS